MGRPKQGERVTGPYAVRNRYRLTFTVLDKEGGEFRKLQETYATKEEALDVKAGFEAGLQQKIILTIKEAIKLYTDTEGKKWKPDSIVNTERNFRRFFPDQTLPLSTLVRRIRAGQKETTYAAQLYQALIGSPNQGLGRSGPIAAATHRGYLKRAKVFMKWCVEQGFLSTNPLAGVKAEGRPGTGKRQLSRDEAKRWTITALEQVEKGDEGALAALLTLLLGVRQSEITLRKIMDVDNVAGPGPLILRIPFAKTAKGIRDREVPSLVEDALRRHIAGRAAAEWLFPWFNPATGQPEHHGRSWLASNVARLCGLAGVNKVCAHSMRGLHSTLAIKRGMSPHLVADELGHESFATTREHYLAPGTLEAVSQEAVTSFLGAGQAAKLLDQLAKRGLGVDANGNLIDRSLRAPEHSCRVSKAAKKQRGKP